MDLRMRQFAVGLAVGAGLGAGAASLAYWRSRGGGGIGIGGGGSAPLRVVAGGRAVAEADLGHPALRFGMPQTEQLRFFSGFVACVDGATRNPRWVLEHFTRDSLSGDGTREASMFYEDSGVDERMRARLSDYQESGYDRGHLAPAANHKSSQKAMDDTFALSNVAPQVGAGFNRDYWARFEKFVKDAAKAADGVYVVTGPLYLPSPAAGDAADGGGSGGGGGAAGAKPAAWRMSYPLIGAPPSLIAVPTHFFKVVLADNASGAHGRHSAALGAFVIPNAPVDPDVPLAAFAVPLDALERAAGARFFPGYVSERRRAAVDRAALLWQDDGRRRMRVLPRAALAQEQAVLLPARATAEAITSAGQPSRSNGWGRLLGGGKQQQQQQQQADGDGSHTGEASVPATVGGDGAVHLCEVTACRLPPERWWERGGGGGNGGSKRGGGNGGGGGRSLQRQGSLKSRL